MKYLDGFEYFFYVDFSSYRSSYMFYMFEKKEQNISFSYRIFPYNNYRKNRLYLVFNSNDQLDGDAIITAGTVEDTRIDFVSRDRFDRCSSS